MLYSFEFVSSSIRATASQFGDATNNFVVSHILCVRVCACVSTNERACIYVKVIDVIGILGGIYSLQHICVFVHLNSV